MASTILRSLTLVPLALLTVSACASPSGGSDEEPVTVVLVADSWSDGDSSSDPVTTRVEATKGHTVTAKGQHEDVDVTFTSVSPQEVTLETSDTMAPEGKTGGINLNDTRTDFTVTAGAPLKFSTPSMDGGTTWVVTIGDAASPTS
ncbi:hypothetical protein [Janibacter limosus]|uniref:hypothetical protein n=1 Tax=Janibacter limosus TaxID=53458 RepID=UPI00083495FD|nr:hypothetical protein [Janibacter limosus]